MRSDTSAKPVLIAALGVALFSMLDAIMKVIASAYPLAQSTGMRYCTAAFTATAFYVIVDGKWPTRDAILRSFPRTVANVIAGSCFLAFRAHGLRRHSCHSRLCLPSLGI